MNQILNNEKQKWEKKVNKKGNLKELYVAYVIRRRASWLDSFVHGAMIRHDNGWRIVLNDPYQHEAQDDDDGDGGGSAAGDGGGNSDADKGDGDHDGDAEGGGWR